MTTRQPVWHLALGLACTTLGLVAGVLAAVMYRSPALLAAVGAAVLAVSWPLWNRLVDRTVGAALARRVENRGP